MSTPKLLIVNSSPEFCQSMAEAFRTFACVECCQSGRQALELLRAHHHELMLLDLTLPQIDGLTVLKLAADEGIHPASLVTMDYQSPYIADAIPRLGISYAILKPCDPESLVMHMLDIAASTLHISAVSTVQNPTDTATDVLIRLGTNPQHSGFQYLKTAIPMYAADPQQFITKELYTNVGKHFGKSGLLVERSMRNAIEKAWDSGNEAAWHKYFPDLSSRPSNKVFIARLAQILMSENGQLAG